MTGLSVITGVLQQLPASARRTLYSILMAAGAVLAVTQVLGWPDWLPFSEASALQAYAFFSPAAGVVAVANVSPSPAGDADLDYGGDDGRDYGGQDFAGDDRDDQPFDAASSVEQSFT
jgi:hypothetical protein